MRILIILIAILALPFASAIGQQPGSKQKVFLKGGSKLTVTQIEVGENDKVLLTLESGEIIEVKKENISKVRKSRQALNLNEYQKQYPVKGLYTKFLSGVNGNYKSGEGTQLDGSFLQFSMGTYLNPNLALGAGISLESFSGYGALPIFFEAMYLPLPEANLAPYGGLRAGLSPGLGWDVTGGPMAHPFAGFRVAGKSRMRLLVEAGMKMQKLHQDWWNTERRLTFWRYTLQVGLAF
ncbi:MAG: hypothetical protein HKN16_12445 [Saprospiraceae bacterium]|nr:hypothetical protein [Saprospiraceae bacterium]